MTVTVAKDFTIRNVMGWHARPCSLITHTVKEHPNVTVTFLNSSNNESAPGASIYKMMMLAVNYGDVIKVTLQGDDPQEIDILMKKLEKIINQMCFEDDGGSSQHF